MKKLLAYSIGIALTLLIGYWLGSSFQTSTFKKPTTQKPQAIVQPTIQHRHTAPQQKPAPKITIPPNKTTEQQLTSLLEEANFQAAVSLLYDTQQNNEKLALALRALFLQHIASLSQQSGNRNTLIPRALEAYIADYYDDTEVLLLLAQYHIDNQQLHDAINTLEAALSYTYNEKDREEIRQLYNKVDQQLNPDTLEQQENITDNSLPLQKINGQFIVTVTLDDIPVSLLIDTGASITTIAAQTFNDIKHRINGTYIREAKFLTANGETTGSLYQVSNLQIGNHLIADTTIAVLDFPTAGSHSGLLGMNVLSKFHFEIDQEQSTLYLRKN